MNFPFSWPNKETTTSTMPLIEVTLITDNIRVIVKKKVIFINNSLNHALEQLYPDLPIPLIKTIYDC